MMNPPHLGHLALVDAVHEQLGLDRVQVVPAGIPPHRRAPNIPARVRLELAISAFADLDHVVVSDTEVERGEHGEVGYMVDTIEEAIDLPDLLGYDQLVVEPTLIVGADQASTLARWHRWDAIVAMARIAIVTRPDHEALAKLERNVGILTQNGARIDVVHMDSVPISSTMVRAAVSAGDVGRVRQLVPEAIVERVFESYQTGSRGTA